MIKAKYSIILMLTIFIMIYSGYLTANQIGNIGSFEIRKVNDDIISSRQIYTEWVGNGSAICTEIDTQWYQELCSDLDGGAIITWTDERKGTDDDVYAQRIDSNGNIRWLKNGTPISTETNNQRFSKICSDTEGGAIITWVDFRGPDADIYAQRINSSGITLWKANGTPISTETGSQAAPEITIDEYGNSIIVWHDFRGSDWDIYAQRLDIYGNVLWDLNGTPICTYGGDQFYPKICPDGEGGAIIIWRDERTVASSDIYAQRINSTGNILWSPNGTVISNENGEQHEPQICSDGLNGAIITWEDDRASNWDIYVQRINSSGNTLLSNNGTPVCTDDDQQRNPKLCGDGAGGTIITWQDDRNSPGVEEIYAQRMDSEGNFTWIANGTRIIYANQEQILPEICSDGAGGAYITWNDYRRVGISDVYMQWIDSNGVIKLTPFGMPISVQFSSQLNPKICCDDNGGAIITWYDMRNIATTGYDIYTQKITNTTTMEEEPELDPLLLLLMSIPQPKILDLFSNPLILSAIYGTVIIILIIALIKKK